jgi:hypothetical protein
MQALTLRPADGDSLTTPIDVPQGSLLTLFWGRDWWEPGPCSLRLPFVIHPAVGLVLTSPPSERCELGPLCRIRPRIVEEAPHWEEMKE